MKSEMNTILLLGDSLTEQGYYSSWASQLSRTYIRRADVVNRGLGGYNSRWVLKILKDEQRRHLLLPPHVKQPLFATLLLGSNDLASNEQHVPVAEYKQNMTEIIQILRRDAQPKGAIFVLTPPPVDEQAWAALSDAKAMNRRFSDTQVYRRAIMEVVAALQSGDAADTPVQLVDLHRVIVQHGDAAMEQKATDGVQYDPAAPWTTLMVDGLHFGEEGGRLFHAALLDAVRQAPRASVMEAKNVPYYLPLWRDVVDVQAASQ